MLTFWILVELFGVTGCELVDDATGVPISCCFSSDTLGCMAERTPLDACTVMTCPLGDELVVCIDEEGELDPDGVPGDPL